MSELSHWIAVASAEHVARGRSEGIMQVCHGKDGPISRVSPGDGIVYYSPTASFGGQDRLQAFTAIGQVRDGPAYRHDTGTGFLPWRRDVDWWPADPAPIRPLLEALELTRGRRFWGEPLRYGLVRITSKDFDCIAQAMRVNRFAMSWVA